MSRLVSDTVDILLARTRQSGGIAVDPDFATEVLGICQQIVNTSLQRILVVASFATTGGQQLYPFSDVDTDLIDIVSIEEGNRELHQAVTLEDLSAYDSTFFTTTGASAFIGWAQMGRDYFILYPAKTAASSVTVTYVQATTIYTDYSALTTEAMELNDEDVEMVLKLAEATLLIRARTVEPLRNTIKSFIDLLEAAKDAKN
jgi:tRNA threonylcarbamoyladenosine modification (KEOPS) complex  Pcc1 subunit